MRVAVYSRVSTDRQTPENQVRELKKVAKNHGWTVVSVYSDTISGATDKRPELDKLRDAIHRREIDLVMAWDMSRLGRSLEHLIGLLNEIQGKGIDLYLHQGRIDTTTVAGKLMFQIMGSFAEFERSMIRERVNSGLARAKAKGKRLGRPPVPPVVVSRCQKLREKGMTYRAIGEKTGLSHTAVRRLLERATTG